MRREQASREEPGRGAGAFARALARLREECGFGSAWRFYHGNGGKRLFPFSYQYYLRIERGGALPRPAWLRLIFQGLREQCDMKECRGLTLAFIEDVMGAEHYRRFVEPLLCRHGPVPHPGSGAIRRWRRREAAAHMTPEQFAAATADEATYWCFKLLSNDRGSWGAAEISDRTGLAREPVSRGLRNLAAVGLAKESAPGRFRGTLAGKSFWYPVPDERSDVHQRRMRLFRERMAGRRGVKFLERLMTIRAEEADIRNVIPLLLEPFDAVDACSRFKRGEKTGIYLIETRVRKLLDF